MKTLICLVLMLGLAACTGHVQQTAKNVWPTDLLERSAAERVIAESREVAIGTIPSGMEFSFRQINENTIQDHFLYRLDQLDGVELLNAVRRNDASNYIRDQELRACQDRNFRYLLDRGYGYEHQVMVFGTLKTGIETDRISKGFCVANEVPLINQTAIDARYSKLRYWPNGDRIDPRLIEQFMGSFQVAASKYRPPDLNNLSIKTVNTQADGLMLSITLEKEQKNTIKGSKYWPQHIKGRILGKSCTNKTSLMALMVGGVYKVQVDIMANKEIIEDGAFTISYPDCLLYNKKPS